MILKVKKEKVLARFSKDRMITVIDKERTMKAINHILTNSKAIPVYNGSNFYDLEFRQIQYSNDFKYRLYIGSGKEKTFVQSNAEGDLDMDKVIEKVNKVNIQYRLKLKRIEDSNNAYRKQLDMLQELNVEFHKKGFELTTGYRNSILISKHYGTLSEEELKEILNTLPNLSTT